MRESKNTSDRDYRERFEALFVRLYPTLFAQGFRICGDRALTNDALQRIFLKVWEKRIPLDSVQNWEAYLRTSVQRDLVRAMKRQQRHHELEVYEPSVPSYEDLLIRFQTDRERAEKLQRLLAELPASERAALEARFQRGDSYETIAEQTGKSKRTVYNQVHRAIKKLRDSFLLLLL